MRKSATAASPHIHDGSSTKRIMLDVIIALVPASITATVFFGPAVLLLTAATIAAAVLFDWGFRRIFKRDVSNIFDLSVVVSALIMVLGIPSNTSLWLSILAAGVAIVVVKHVAKRLLGGAGRSMFNPALIGHIVVTELTAYGTSYPTPMSWLESSSYFGADAMASATPLQLLADGNMLPSLWQLFLGLHGGTMGETSILALLIGAGYLVWRRVISPAIPLAYIGTTILVVTLAGHDPLLHLLSGSLVFVAFFMATDYATSPINLKGKILFGIGCGLITVLIRLYGSTTEGVTVALLVMNTLVIFIDRLTLPKALNHR
ncbi:MAG: RnfABCDGE type electron transport complex subunit D [Oscillospiraceae bacterium]|nr:RnfABCDGE type electron transport complex subunit D [Oscillospiraceae bacterium]